MARPIKQGIDYFPVDVGFLQDIKIRKITRACGISAIPILLSLLIIIFRDEGYYVGWDDEMPFLIADSVGVSEGAVIETVNKAVQMDFFNANMFNTYSILTSAGIQRRFFKAVERRKEVCYDARFLLISENVRNNPINVSNNSRNATDNQQSKVKESKEKNIYNGSNGSYPVDNIIKYSFAYFWLLYPKKVDREKAETAFNGLVASGIYASDLCEAVSKYKKQCEHKFMKQPFKFLSDGFWKQYIPKANKACPLCGGIGYVKQNGCMAECECIFRYSSPKGIGGTVE
jgi:hypothetical protein